MNEKEISDMKNLMRKKEQCINIKIEGIKHTTTMTAGQQQTMFKQVIIKQAISNKQGRQQG